MRKLLALSLSLVFVFSLSVSNNSYSGEKGHSMSEKPRTPISCATSKQLLELSKHLKNHLRYKCKDITIRQAVAEMENSDIYHDDPKKGGFFVRFPGRLNFENAKAKLPKKAKDLLKRFAKVLNEYDNKVTVRGHASTPNIKTTKFPSNQELSEKRAKNVAKYLKKRGVSGERLMKEGFAARELYVEEIDKETEGLNRRVDFFIKN